MLNAAPVWGNVNAQQLGPPTDPASSWMRIMNSVLLGLIGQGIQLSRTPALHEHETRSAWA
jgi:hypothetical protein